MNWPTMAMTLAAPLLGVLGAHSATLWGTSGDNADEMVRRAKEALLDSAGLRELHHEVYAKVGEKAWENAVKPDFLSAITWATVRESGNPLPGWEDIVAWVRAHPREARQYLENAAATALAAPP